MASMKDFPRTEVVYTFVEHNGTPTHIAASTLRDVVESAMRKHERAPIMAEISESLVTALEAGALGVEPPHALTLPDAALEVPVLVCEWGDSHVIADGSHRLWRRWKRGDTHFPAWIVPEPVWRLFVIDDMPGDGQFWDEFNRTAQIRTPELEALHKLLGGK